MTFSPPKEEPDPGMEWRPVSELIDKRGRFGRCTIHGYDFLTPPGGGACLECTVTQRIEAREQAKGWHQVNR